MDYITTYYRDDKAISFEEFKKVFDEDLEKENENCTWDIRDEVYGYWSDGIDIKLNGHEYKRRTDSLCDSAKELFEEFLRNGNYKMIIDVLKEMTEEEIFNIVSKMKCVNIKNDKFLLKDGKDWY